MRVMSWNIAAGGGDLSRIEAVIRAEAPDVVGLQEVDVHWDARSGHQDQARLLAERLGYRVVFAPIYHLPPTEPGRPPREFGVAILARHPLRASVDHPLTRLSTQSATPVPEPMPGFPEVVVEIGGRELRVFDTHLDYRADPAVRETQVREMLERIGGDRRPTVLLGDLNARPGAPELRPLLARLRDAWQEAGSGEGYTYPAATPDRRIDYVLVSEGVRVREIRVVATGASDHRPVVADLVLPP